MNLPMPIAALPGQPPLGACAPDSAVSEPAPLSGEELAVQAQGGCEEAFEALVSAYAGRIYNFLFQMTRNAHDAEDLAQETFVRAFRSIERYDPRYGFSTWLFTIAKRLAASHFRSSRRAVTEEFEESHAPLDFSTPSSELESRDQASSLWDLARTLKRNQYEVLWLRYGESFSVEQTAQVMGATQIYVKVLLHRARGNLGKLLRKNGFDGGKFEL